MTDIFDRASELEEQQRRDALEAQEIRAGLTGKTVEDSAKQCQRCEEPISLKRRKAYPGVQLCADCKTLQERAARPR